METNQLTFEHICFKYKGNDNQLFTDLDVTMETGQVVGILGASGSGKTTLTEILLGQLKPTCQQFRILENGKPVTAGSRSWSYVPQQNLLREYLKVSETFDFYADHHLKGSGKLTKKHRIAGIMDDLGLTEFANKKISELSGGQKRRVSIGIELLIDICDIHIHIFTNHIRIASLVFQKQIFIGSCKCRTSLRQEDNLVKNSQIFCIVSNNHNRLVS